MKTITIPPPVAINDLNGNPSLDGSGKQIVITFQSFVEGSLLIDQKFGKSMAHILGAVEIKNRLKDATQKLELENNHWQMLNDVASEPSSGYNPVVVMQLVVFLNAIKDAV